jgi:hypothetical protein
MKTFGKTGLMLAALALLACEQPFKAGLGQQVDIKKPSISLVDPAPGAYLKGEWTFNGLASDDIKLTSVQIMVSNYPGLPNPESSPPVPDANGYFNEFWKYQRLGQVNQPLNKSVGALAPNGVWSVTIDTAKFPDGDFKIRLKATDNDGKFTETDELAFIIKNTRPTVDMAIPAVSALRPEDDKNAHANYGKAGSKKLNYLDFAPGPFINTMPRPLTAASDFVRILDTGGSMVGIADDRMRIETQAASTGQFPPQIRFWALQPNSSGIPVYDNIPSEGQLPWKNLRDYGLESVGATSWQFAYYLTENGQMSGSSPLEADRYYAFQVRVMSEDGTEFYYPQYSNPDFAADTINLPNAGDPSKMGSLSDPNNCVIIYLRQPQEYPEVSLLGLENINAPENEVNIVDSEPQYPPLYVEEPHQYFDKINVIKRGPFTLRVKASHSMGIERALVQWKRQGASAADAVSEGVFVWDRVDGVTQPHYEYWGKQDSYTRIHKYFTFTYTDTAADAGKILGPQNSSGVRAELAADGNGHVLPEGTYDLTIYVWAVGGMGLPEGQGYQAGLQIDRQSPTISLTKIEGSVGDVESAEPADGGRRIYTVNGAVRPDLQIADGSALDSGLRPGSLDPYYRKNPGLDPALYGSEQRYLLVNAANKTLLDAKIAAASAAKPYWPPKADDITNGQSALQSQFLSADGYQVLRHGPVFANPDQNKNVFLSSQLYTILGTDPGTGATDADYLADGKYYLYVFARDRAYNVYSDYFIINVDKETDRPKFDFSGGKIEQVTDPNRSADYDGTPATEANGKGFVIKNGAASRVRNRFSSGDTLKVRIEDDDSLKLGDSVEPSGVQVWIAGSMLQGGDENNNIIPDVEVQLADAVVKGIFAPPLDGSGSQQTAKSSSGAITQQDLVNALKAVPPYSTIPEFLTAASLPEGIYRVRISIGDLPAKKLNLPGASATPALTTEDTLFWFVVDNIKPAADITSPSLTTHFISAETTVDIIGTVADKNGPITVTEFTVTPKSGTPTPLPGTIVPYNFNPVRNAAITTEWAYDFIAPLNMGGNEGTYTVALKFKDRFGNQGEISRDYSVDKQPPVVAAANRIRVFERPELDNDDAGGEEANKSILANGVVSFSVIVTDNNPLDSIKYILTTAAAPPADYDDASYASINTAARPYAAYIDTALLTDGKYNLFVRAKDAAGNISAAAAPLQTVYLLQEEDKPFFRSNIGPSNKTVGEEGLIVSGAITDDDGFLLADATTVTDFANANTAQIRFSSDGSGQANDSGTWTAWTAIPDAMLTLSGTNLELNVNMMAVFTWTTGAVPGGDSKKAFQVRAADSGGGVFAKFTAAGGPSTERVWRASPVYQFTLDTLAPVVTINQPRGADSYGGIYSQSSQSSFALVGQIKELNLAIEREDLANIGQHYFTWNLDDQDEHKYWFALGATGGGAGSDEWNFNIPISDPTLQAAFDLAKAQGGTHSVTISARDESGKDKLSRESFVIDLDPPAISLNLDHTVPLPKPGEWGSGTAYASSPWWDNISGLTGDPRQTWFAEKAKWLALTSHDPVPVKFYNPGIGVSLTGTFSDAESDIDLVAVSNRYTNLEYSIDGGTWRNFWDSDTSPRRAYVTGSGKTVQWSIPLEGLSDGLHSVSLKVKDVQQNATPTEEKLTMFAFRVDSAQPLVPTAAASGNASGGIFGLPSQMGSGVIFTLTGTSTDANIKDVQLTINTATPKTVLLVSQFGTDAGVVQPVWTYDVADSAHNLPGGADQIAWGYQVTAAEYAALTGGASGKYTISIQGLDHAGKLTSPAYEYEFTLDAVGPGYDFGGRNTYPGAAFGGAETVHTATLPNPKLFATGNADKINLLTGNQPRLTGTVEDPLTNGASSHIAELQTRIEKFVYAAGDTEVASPVEGNWQALNNILGQWTSLANTGLRTTLSANITQSATINWARTLSTDTDDGYPNLTDGLYRMRMRARDSTYIQNGGVFGMTTVGGNPTQSPYLYFYYDTGKPELKPTGLMNIYNTVSTGNTLTFSGTASDKNRIRNVTVELYDSADSQKKFGIHSNDTSMDTSGGEEFTWTVVLDNLTGFQGGAYYIRITATDNAGQQTSVRHNFTLDNNLPTGLFESPVYWESVNHRAVLSGGQLGDLRALTQDENGITEVKYLLGYQGQTKGILTDGKIGKDNLLITPFQDGQKAAEQIDPILLNYLKTYDGTLGWISIGQQWGPQTGYTANSETVDAVNFETNKLLIVNNNPYDLSFTFKDLNLLLDTQTGIDSGIRAKPLADSINFGSLPSEAQTTAGFYSLPLILRLVDGAGNVNYIARDIWINPDGDRPVNSVLDPVTSAENAPRGGTISANGVAADNTWVHDVIYRVTVGDASLSNATVIYMNGVAELSNDEKAIFTGTPGTPPSYETAYGDGSQWRKANLETSGSSVPWNFTLNANDEIKSRISTLGYASSGGGRDKIRVKLEILVIDAQPNQTSPKRFSSLETREFYIVDAAPEIDAVKIGPNFYEALDGKVPVKGMFTISAVAKSPATNIRYVDFRRQGVSGWTRVFNEDATPAADKHSQPFSVTFNSIDANDAAASPAYSVMGGVWAVSGGNYRVEIRVQDNQTPAAEAIYTVEVKVDNFVPAVDPNINTNTVIAGTNEFFTGRALDYTRSTSIAEPAPPIRGVSRVYAWLTRGTDYVKLLYGSAAGNALTEPIASFSDTQSFSEVYQGRAFTVNDNSTPAYTDDVVNLNAAGSPAARTAPKVSKTGDPVGDQWAIDITENLPQNGIYFSPNGGDWDKTWAFRVDTTRLPDGPVTLHYIVFDAAGNASYHTQDTVIKNRTPRIRTIEVGTDLQGLGSIGAVATTQNSLGFNVDNFRSQPYIDSGFTVKNQNLGFKVTTDHGNSPLSYRVQYAHRNAAAAVDTSVMTVGQVYTIAATGNLSAAAWASLGAPSPNPGTHFTFIYSGAQITDTATVYSYTQGLAGANPVYDAAFIASVGGTNPVTEWDTTVTSDEAKILRFTGINGTGGFFANGAGTFGTDGIVQNLGSKGHQANYAPNASSSNADMAFFIIKVWDNVEQGSPALPVNTLDAYEYRQLSDIAVIGMNVYQVDATPPAMRLYDLNPYTEEAVTGNNIGAGIQTTIDNAASPLAVGQNISRGGLYNTGTTRNVKKSGHIEPRDNTLALGYPTVPVTGDTVTTGSAPDQVSGKVILRGVANDNNLIGSIKIKIGDNAEKTILELNAARKIVAVGGQKAWAAESLDWASGHTVEWAYLWDTEAEPASGAPAASVVIQTKAQDYKTTPDDSPTVLINGETPVSNTWHNQINVDIVPYITGIERQSKYATTRSRQGWYSFYQDETGAAVLGYNLKGAAGTPGMTISSGIGGGSSTNLTVTSSTVNKVEFSVPNNAVSGRINYNSNGTTGIAALNHRNKNSQSWNRQNHRYVAGSTFWNDDPHAHVWRSREQGGDNATYFPNSANADSMSMSLKYDTSALTGLNNAGTTNARILGAWTIFSNGTWNVGGNWGVGGTSSNFTVDNEQFSFSDISYYNAAANNGFTTAVSYLGDGTPTIRYATDASTGGGTTAHTPGGDNAVQITKGLQNTRVAYTNNAGNQQRHMVTYDYRFKRLIYLLNNNATYLDGNNPISGTSAASVPAQTGGLDAIRDAGNWSAIDVTSAGVPVVAYYDRDNDTLRLAYRDGVIAIPTGRWYQTAATLTLGQTVYLGTVNTAYYVVWVGTGVDAGKFMVSNMEGGLPAAPVANVTGNNVLLATRTVTGTRAGNNNNYYYNTGEAHGLAEGNRVLVGTDVYYVRTGTNSSATAFRVSQTDTGTGGYNAGNNNQTFRVVTNTMTSTNTTSLTSGVSDVARWTRKEVIPQGDTYYRGSGSYVSMAIDHNDSDKIHLAFYNTTKNTMVYAVGSIGSASTNLGFKTYAVDSGITGGAWTDISVDENHYPWIVYMDSSRSGNYDGARIAYQSTFFDNATSGGSNPIGVTDTNNGWEAVQMPADYTVIPDRLNIEAWPPSKRNNVTLAANTGWNAAVGYGSSTGAYGFRLAYFNLPSFKGY